MLVNAHATSKVTFAGEDMKGVARLISWRKQISAEVNVMDTTIKAVNLTKHYGKLLAVDRINFEVVKAHGNGGSIGFRHMC